MAARILATPIVETVLTNEAESESELRGHHRQNVKKGDEKSSATVGEFPQQLEPFKIKIAFGQQLRLIFKYFPNRLLLCHLEDSPPTI